MRAIVTGAAGFIGSHVCQHLHARGWEVLGIDDLSGGRRENVPADVTFVERDCSQSLDDLFTGFHPQAVLHLAAYAAEGLSHHIPVFNYGNNIVGTANVLAAAQRVGVAHFVFTSSIAAYGHPSAERPFREADTCHPCDPYGIAKLACEQHIRAVHEYYGGPSYTIFRPHNVYGPKQNVADPYRNVVGIFVRCALEGKAMPIFGDGMQTRCFSYIDPVAIAIVDSLTNLSARNRTFNIGSDEPTTVIELAKTVADVIGVDPNLEMLPARTEVQHAHAEHRLANEVFAEAYQHSLSLREVLSGWLPGCGRLEYRQRLPALRRLKSAINCHRAGVAV